MDNMEDRLIETHEEAPHEPPLPPIYSSLSISNSLAKLSTLSRVNIRLRSVTTEHGELIFDLTRETECNGCCPSLYLDLHDTNERMVIRLKPGQKKCKYGFDVFIEEQYVADVRVKGFFRCIPKYVVSDANGEKVLLINLGCFWGSRTMSKLKDLQDNQIGTITRIWNFWAFPSMFFDREMLQLDFPRDLEVQYKAAVIGFCYLVVRNPMNNWVS